MQSNIGAFPGQIYFNALNKMEIGVIVIRTAPSVTRNGRKVVLAGTPLAGNLENRSVAFATAADATAVGVLVHDVDVTDGDANGTLCIWGFVNLDRLETSVQALLTTGVKATLAKSIVFLKDN